MKKILVLLMIVPIFTLAQNKYEWKEVKTKNELLILKSTKEPVTGIVEGKLGWFWRWIEGAHTHNAVYNNGKVISCVAYYKNGQMHHKNENNYAIAYYRNGNIMLEGNYINNKKNGIWKEYHEDGGLSEETTYKDDLREGPFKYYNDEGKLIYEGNYKDDMEHGLFITYDTNGVIKKEIRYKNGERIRSN